MSASTVTDRAAFMEKLSTLARMVADADGALVLGGRAVFATQLPALPATHVVASMSELAALGRSLKSGQVTRVPVLSALLAGGFLAGGLGLRLPFLLLLFPA